MLDLLPCFDSPALAASLRRRLDLPRHEARALGRSAVEAIEAGSYAGATGRRVDWSDALDRARAAKRSLPPDAPLPPSQPRGLRTRVQVCNQTTLEAAQALLGRGLRPLALNLANGVSPGGGFLHGARAQEESICRVSGLYATLVDDPMYAAHEARPLPDSTAWAILSPDVPIFRDEEGAPLPAPWTLSLLTCAAPYAPTVGQPASAELLRARIERVLEIARAFHYTTLVLGAWGCGAFGNDPRRTAQDFRAALEGPMQGAFGEVVFAIADWSEERRFLGPFRDAFAPR